LIYLIYRIRRNRRDTRTLATTGEKTSIDVARPSCPYGNRRYSNVCKAGELFSVETDSCVRVGRIRERYTRQKREKPTCAIAETITASPFSIINGVVVTYVRRRTVRFQNFHPRRLLLLYAAKKRPGRRNRVRFKKTPPFV